MTDKQWEFWERRNKAALLFFYGPKGVDKRLAKLKEKTRRNAARINSCKLHDFDWRKRIEAEKKRRENSGVEVPIPPTIKTEISCRCKNCGGKMPVSYAAPYMEALEHAKALTESRKEAPGKC